MSPQDGKLLPWRDIARELAQEQNPTRILALSKELSEAVEAQGTEPEVESTSRHDGKAPEPLPE